MQSTIGLTLPKGRKEQCPHSPPLHALLCCIDFVRICNLCGTIQGTKQTCFQNSNSFFKWCKCFGLLHLKALTSVGVWVQIYCLFVPLTLLESEPELPSVITLSCLCKYRLSLKEKRIHLSNILYEKCGCRFQEKCSHKTRSCRRLSHVMAKNTRRKSSAARGHGLKNTQLVSSLRCPVEGRKPAWCSQGVVWCSCPCLPTEINSWAHALVGICVSFRNSGIWFLPKYPLVGGNHVDDNKGLGEPVRL